MGGFPGTTVACGMSGSRSGEVLVTRSSVRLTVLALAALLAAPAVAGAQSRRVATGQSRVPPAQARQAVPVARTGAPVIVGARHYSSHYLYRPYNYGFYGSWYYPFGFSIGFGYSPWYGYGYPYAYGYPAYGYPYAYGPWGYPGPYGPAYYGSSVRLQVMPREAEVFVDGYYAGKVDNFDGTFQRLNIEPGEYELQLFMPGHRSFTQKIYVQPTSTFRVQHTMEPLGAGEPEPTRPVAQPRSGRRPEPYVRPDRPNARGSQRPESRASDETGNVTRDFGSIALRVQPGDATITVDGERWEGAPDQDRLEIQLGVGTHTVEIRKDGYRTYITDITVRPGETTPLNVSLTRQ